MLKAPSRRIVAPVGRVEQMFDSLVEQLFDSERDDDIQPAKTLVGFGVRLCRCSSELKRVPNEGSLSFVITSRAVSHETDWAGLPARYESESDGQSPFAGLMADLGKFLLNCRNLRFRVVVTRI